MEDSDILNSNLSIFDNTSDGSSGDELMSDTDLTTFYSRNEEIIMGSLFLMLAFIGKNLR